MALLPVPSVANNGPRQRRPRPRRWLGAVYLLTAVVLGLVAVVVAVGPAVGLHTVRLATGSMSPGLPADSLLLVQDTPGSDVRVGDVVMVQRPDHRPVTHRVVSVEPSPDTTRDTTPGTSGGSFALILRGDANTINDPEPYLVDDVGRMVLGVPVGGQLITALSSVAGMAVLTVLFGALTLWVLWPSQQPAASHEAASPEETPSQ
jgi:signal peptidase